MTCTIASSALATGAEMRRRALPALVATLILIGGLSGALTHGPWPLVWTGALVAAVLLDQSLARRIADAGVAMNGARALSFVAWTGLASALFCLLPAWLWIAHGAEAAPAAIALWLAGAVRQQRVNRGSLALTLGAVAPIALSCVLAPLLWALATPQRDWTAAILTVGAAAALFAYVASTEARARPRLAGPPDQLDDHELAAQEHGFFLALGAATPSTRVQSRANSAAEPFRCAS
jgi:hypothetical protein